MCLILVFNFNLNNNKKKQSNKYRIIKIQYKMHNSCLSFFELVGYLVYDTVETINEYVGNLFTTSNTNFYYLSLINDDKKGWSIHGLWPQYSSNSYPSFCRKVDFDYQKLSPILGDLHKHWYSTEEPTTEFWEHEWKKHGSCMFNNCDELEYFRRGLELYVTSVEQDIIEKYKVSDTKSIIPFDLNFNLIEK